MAIKKTAAETQIQAIGSEFARVCVDSGAGESVCPFDAFPDLETHETSKVGTKYRVAEGQVLVNVRGKMPQFTTNEIKTSMVFQATSGLEKPLAAASRITAKGNRIVPDEERSESHIENKMSGVRAPLKLENGVYMMEMIVQPFTRRAN